ncbi:MAG: VOC family protein [Ilumatobacteraceae bacterium]
MSFRGINHVAFVVSDMDRAVRFYKDVLGLREVDAFPDRSFVALSWGTNIHDIALIQGGDVATRARSGVHHVALSLAGGPVELSELAEHLRRCEVNIRMAFDHVVTRSIYFSDPDGNQLEVFVDMPRETWEHIPHAMLQGGPLEV